MNQTWRLTTEEGGDEHRLDSKQADGGLQKKGDAKKKKSTPLNVCIYSKK